MRALAGLVVGACASAGAPYQGVTHLTATTDVDHDGVRGERLAGEFGYRGVEISLDAGAQRLERANDAGTYKGGGIDLGLRLSIFGMLISDGDHRLEHWFDLGAEGRAGGGFTSLDSFGEVSAGGWVELGLWSGDDYPALIFDVRRTVDTGPWNDDTIIGIGLAWTRRPHPTDDE